MESNFTDLVVIYFKSQVSFALIIVVIIESTIEQLAIWELIISKFLLITVDIEVRLEGYLSLILIN